MAETFGQQNIDELTFPQGNEDISVSSVHMTSNVEPVRGAFDIHECVGLVAYSSANSVAIYDPE